MTNCERIVSTSESVIQLKSADGSSIVSLHRTPVDIYQFGAIDIHTGDIDPVYFMLNQFYHEDELKAKRWALAFLCFYHTGTAAKAAEFRGKEFYAYIREVYPTAPRAAERRHWRGAQGLRSLDSIEAFAPSPEDFWSRLGECKSYGDVRRICESGQLVGFGSYFVLKIVDFLDRCFCTPISYEGLEKNLPSLPAEALKLHGGSLHSLRDEFQKRQLFAPPLYDRLIGLGEVETILCDWKRAKYGRHQIGDDIMEKRRDFEGSYLKDYLPGEIPLDLFDRTKL